MKCKYILVILWTLLHFVACKKTKNAETCQETIVENKILTFPWLARLEYLQLKDNKSVGFACWGTIIHKNVVLTAGHCIINMAKENLTLFKVQVGSFAHPPFTNIPVAKTEVHPQYLDGLSDIALVILQQEISFTAKIQAIPLFDIPYNKRNLFIVNTKQLSEFKFPKWLNNSMNSVKKVKFGKCFSEYFAQQIYISKRRHICALADKRDACSGESGGPLLAYECSWKVYGIVSMEKACDSKYKRPGVYTKVYFFKKWIRNVMKKHFLI